MVVIMAIKNIDYGLLSANAIAIPGVFIFFAIASQLPASTIIGFHQQGCYFGFNLSSTRSDCCSHLWRFNVRTPTLDLQDVICKRSV